MVIDKNLAVEQTIQEKDVVYYDAEKAPISLHGIFRDGDRFRRLPETVAKKVNPGIEILHWHTAGGRVRFMTDSEYVAVHVRNGDY